jgi:hypothetical protein
MMLGNLVIYVQKTKNRSLPPFIKIYSKQIKVLNVRPETFTLLQEKKNRENSGRYRPRYFPNRTWIA